MELLLNLLIMTTQSALFGLMINFALEFYLSTKTL
jgi:hypothetical protein